MRGFGIAWVRRRALKAGLALILVFAAAFIALPMALDIRRQAEMRKELGDLIRDFGFPSIVVTHDLRDVVSIGDIVSLMETGGISHRPESGTPLSAGESQTST